MPMHYAIQLGKAATEITSAKQAAAATAALTLTNNIIENTPALQKNVNKKNYAANGTTKTHLVVSMAVSQPVVNIWSLVFNHV